MKNKTVKNFWKKIITSAAFFVLLSFTGTVLADADLVSQKLMGEEGASSTQIAYILVKNNTDGTRRYGLEIADYNGNNPRELMTSAEPLMSPSWSPDGKRIAYVAFKNNQSAIYSIDVATGKFQQLQASKGINSGPAWSPDGLKMAMALSITGNPEIYIKDLATGELTQITHNNSLNAEPSWSADGQSLLFTSDWGGAPQIYRINLASKQTSRLTFAGKYNASGSEVPAQNKLVFLHGNQGMYNVAVKDLTTNQLHLLTSTGLAASPTVSPDGSRVLYSTYYGGRRVLATVSLNGRSKFRLPVSDGNMQQPAWSPKR